MINNTKHFGYTVGHGVQVAKYIKRRLALMAYPNNFSIVKALAERLNVLMSSLLMEFLFVARIFFVHIRMLKITFQIMDFDLKFLLMLNLDKHGDHGVEDTVNDISWAGLKFMQKSI